MASEKKLTSFPDFSPCTSPCATIPLRTACWGLWSWWEWWSVDRSNLADDLLLWCCHSSFDVSTSPWYCHSSFATAPMLLILLWCFHFTLILPTLLSHSSNVAAPPMLLLLLQCSYSTLRLPFLPSTLTLNQCCHSFDGFLFLLIPNVTAPPLRLLPLLECCLNLQCPQ